MNNWIISRGNLVPAAPLAAAFLTNRSVELDPVTGNPVGHARALGGFVPMNPTTSPALVRRVQRSQGAPSNWNGAVVNNAAIAAADRAVAAGHPVTNYHGIVEDALGRGWKVKVFDVTGAPYVPGPSPQHYIVVVVTEIGASCTCPDCQNDGCTCKHIFYVLRTQFGIPAASLLNPVAVQAFLGPEFATML